MDTKGHKMVINPTLFVNKELGIELHDDYNDFANETIIKKPVFSRMPKIVNSSINRDLDEASDINNDSDHFDKMQSEWLAKDFIKRRRNKKKHLLNSANFQTIMDGIISPNRIYQQNEIGSGMMSFETKNYKTAVNTPQIMRDHILKNKSRNMLPAYINKSSNYESNKVKHENNSVEAVKELRSRFSKQIEYSAKNWDMI